MKETGYPSIDKIHFKGEKFTDVHPVIPSISIDTALRVMSLPFRLEKAVNSLDLEVNFNELLDDASMLARGFKELGVKRGDIVSICMPNLYQGVISFLALNRIGATTTFLNSFSSIDEVKHYLNLFESPIFINYNKDEKYNESIKKDTKVKQVITLYNKDVNKKEFSENKITGYEDTISFNDMKKVSEYYKKPFRTLYFGSENSLILFTSGTTGNPKSVVLTNKNILSSGIYMKASAKLDNTKGESSLVCVPFTYPYGFATSTLMSLLCGRKAILCPDLSKDNISYYLSKKPNIIFGSPALLELIMKNINPNQDLSSVDTFISGGDFLLPQKSREAKEFFKAHGANVKMCNGSGNAETSGANTNAVGLPTREETVGRVLTGTDVIIMDENYEKELKYGEEGLLCIGGKHVFKEYYKSPELTKNAKFMYKGKMYFKTGTRGILYKDGFFNLTGRDSRFYITSTLNKIYCDRVQMIMSNIDIIEDVAFVQKKDDDLLYTGKAYVVLKQGINKSNEAKEYILEKCHQTIVTTNGEEMQLKENEIPTSIEFIDKLPRHEGSDKIDYKVLEELALIEYNNEKKLIKKI